MKFENIRYDGKFADADTVSKEKNGVRYFSFFTAENKFKVGEHKIATVTWLAAFAQIIFSLSMGQAIALTYASYLPENSKLIDNVFERETDINISARAERHHMPIKKS